jgi:hypothetical protein
MRPSTIDLDLAKHVFQVQGVDGAGQVVVRKKLRRSELLAFFNLKTAVGWFGFDANRALSGSASIPVAALNVRAGC